MSLQLFTGAYCVARALLASKRGCLTGDILAQTGRLTCLYDSVAYLKFGGPYVAPPHGDDGPCCVKDFNNASGYDSQRGLESLWLTLLPADEAIQCISARNGAKRRRTNYDRVEFLCWQPYGEDGHFFTVRSQSPSELIVFDGHVGETVKTTPEDFIKATSGPHGCFLTFFALSVLRTSCLPDMVGTEYDLEGGGPLRTPAAPASAAPAAKHTEHALPAPCCFNTQVNTCLAPN